MPFTNIYCTRDEFKARYFTDTFTQTTHDTRIENVLESISREIDEHCGRHFYVKHETRYYTAEWGEVLEVDDLLSVTSLKTDEDGDRTYERTWSSTDYDLEPYNNAGKSRGYTQIYTAPNGLYAFPTTRKGVEIAGKWGYYEHLVTSSVTASAIGSTSTTSVTVSNATNDLDVGHTILIDSEQMRITAISSTTLTVVRGVNGTTAATHGAASTIQYYTYPVISEACLLLAQRTFKRKDAPFGVVGSAEMGQQIVIPKNDPDVARMLQRFVKDYVGAI